MALGNNPKYETVQDVLVHLEVEYGLSPYKYGYIVDVAEDKWIFVADLFDSRTGELSGYTYTIYESDGDGADNIFETGDGDDLEEVARLLREYD